ncbi:MAG: adenylate kinase [Candidatus Bathyarchaeia archaeon]
MKRRIIIVGIPGVGKTTVIEEFRRLAEDDGLKCRVMNFGSVMLEIAKDIIKDRDEIRKASMDIQHQLQRKAAETIAQEGSDGIIIVDTHVLIETNSGYLPGIPYHVLQGLKPDMIALVEASPEEILFRRSNDKTRRRDSLSAEEVKEHLQLSRAMVSTCATLAGIPFGILVNKTGCQREAAAQLLEMVKN